MFIAILTLLLPEERVIALAIIWPDASFEMEPALVTNGLCFIAGGLSATTRRCPVLRSAFKIFAQRYFGSESSLCFVIITFLLLVGLFGFVEADNVTGRGILNISRCGLTMIASSFVTTFHLLSDIGWESGSTGLSPRCNRSLGTFALLLPLDEVTLAVAIRSNTVPLSHLDTVSLNGALPITALCSRPCRRELRRAKVLVCSGDTVSRLECGWLIAASFLDRMFRLRRRTRLSRSIRTRSNLEAGRCRLWG